eukprot:6119424-Pyramimonas_sp.AAC.1
MPRQSLVCDALTRCPDPNRVEKLPEKLWAKLRSFYEEASKLAETEERLTRMKHVQCMVAASMRLLLFSQLDPTTNTCARNKHMKLRPTPHTSALLRPVKTYCVNPAVLPLEHAFHEGPVIHSHISRSFIAACCITM